MLLRLKMFLVWLRRLGHCKGFGIQSPSAYRFAADVVNDHTRYAAYASLDNGLRLTAVERKMGYLLFRLAKSQPREATFEVADLPQSAYYARCFHAGEAERSASSAEEALSRRPQVVMVEPSEAGLARVETLMRDAVEGDQLVVLGIHASAEAFAHWLRMADDPRSSVSFDLYYCGILFFDRRFKQGYIVNF